MINPSHNVGVIQAYFSPSGSTVTLPSAGTCGASLRPAHEPAITTPASAASIDASYLNLNSFESVKLDVKPGYSLKPMVSLPGSGVKAPGDVLAGNVTRTFKAMLLQRHKLALALANGIAIPVDTGSNTELAAATPDQVQVQYGWLYYEMYDGRTASLMLERGYYWTAATLNGDIETDSNKQLVYGVDFTVIANALNEVIIRNV